MKRSLFFILILFSIRVTTAQMLNVLMWKGEDAKRLQYGTGILGVGDVNNDGWPDLAVGVHKLKKTQIYFGGPGILDTTADFSIAGDGPMVKGDLNGDGRMDIVISNYNVSDDTIYVYFGKSPSPYTIDTIPNIKIAPEGLGTEFGEGAGGMGLSIGDINGDKYDDLVIGARNFDGSHGKVYISFGGSFYSGIINFTAVGDSIEEFFGYSLSVGDINGDGYADIAVSSDSRRTPPTIDVWYGAKNFEFNRHNYQKRFILTSTWMLCVSFVDINVDGKADLSYSAGNKTCFHLGRSDSISTTPDFEILADAGLSAWGGALKIGDVNGDGKEDFVIRHARGGYASMCIDVYLGNRWIQTKYVSGICKGDVAQDPAYKLVAPLGDLNGDGVNDFGGTVYIDSSPEYLQDGFFAVFGGDKSWITEVSEENRKCPCSSSLSQNYPNPFNPTTIISYQLSVVSNVRLLLFDILGREVVTLVNELNPVGKYSVTWNGRDNSNNLMPSGVYIYQLFVNGVAVEARKLIVNK